MEQSIFRESQSFNQCWLWVLLIGVIAFVFYLQSSLGLIILIPVCLLFFSIRLNTQIDENGLNFRLFPFLERKINWKDISSAKVVNYGFVGGWGIRLFTSCGTIYNVKGSKGLAVGLKNGRKFCLGTQKPQKLKRTLSSISDKNDF